MTTYKDSGVDISAGDKASAAAYKAAKSTFSSRKNMIGEPVTDDGGFAGLLDMGDFFLVQNDDGVGTKSMIAEDLKKYDTLGYDLVCMVADDAICLGAEVISITNTMDVDKVDHEKVEALMKGLAKAASEQKIVLPGGEIAELGKLANGYIWNATAVGIVEKTKVIDCSNIEPGDKLIGLYSPGFRSNGLSLVRKILNDSFGAKYTTEKFNENQSFAEATLTPSVIFHDAILKLHGRYKEKSRVNIKGIAHITGGGIPGNISRILKKKTLGAHIDNPCEPDEIVKKIQSLGNVTDKEAYETWNMGTGMILACNETEKVIEEMKKNNIHAQVIGHITDKNVIDLRSRGTHSPDNLISWPVE
jgi:phosphoribosylformylglycinamidine cyclo-ligase